MPLSNGTQRSFRAAAVKIGIAANELQKVTGYGLRLIGEEIMTDVKSSRPGHGVPVDTGVLRGSGRVDGPVTVAPHRERVTLSFGDAAATYALVQHEVLTYKHTVGEARYLVRGLQRWRPGGSGALAALRANSAAAILRASRGAP